MTKHLCFLLTGFLPGEEGILIVILHRLGYKPFVLAGCLNPLWYYSIKELLLLTIELLHVKTNIRLSLGLA